LVRENIESEVPSYAIIFYIHLFFSVCVRCPMERRKKITSEVLSESDTNSDAVSHDTPSEQLEGEDLSVYESNWTTVEDDDDEWLDPDTFDPEGHPDWTEESWDESRVGGKDNEKENEPIYMPKYMSRLTAFNPSFCSFIQAIHGGERRTEKFSYLVAQKIIGGSGVLEKAQQSNPFGDVNLADLIAAGIKTLNNSEENLEKVISIEDRYLESDADELGLELVRGENLHSWGRLVRPPLKRKGHVIIDFCSGQKMGQGGGDIIRHVVTKNTMSKLAPGAYSAARKARWGGFWPDLSGRLGDFAETDADKNLSSANEVSYTKGLIVK
jgi:hypothetical protein